ncbi:hypothetical protein R1flu_001125 [Riccia fluitans]|uniref:Uncharacterized protein n=1 Tax=Riccia fluitans TaxID=41844 RepID=A0ABD1Y2F9_9MARC
MALLWFCRYEEALGILEKDYPNGKEAVAYIKAIDPRKFSRYALVLPRYGRVTSNAVECMNAAFLKLREYAARRLLFEVWIYVMRSFYERRTTAEGSIDLLTEYAKGRLSEFERKYGRYVTYNANDDNALVQTNGGVDQWIVRRHPRLSCSCYEPQEMQWPCIHDEARLISSQGPLTAISDQAVGPSTQDGRGKSQRSVNRVHVDPIIRVYRGRPRTTRVNLDPGRPLMRNERCFARNATCGGLSAKWKMTKCETLCAAVCENPAEGWKIFKCETQIDSCETQCVSREMVLESQQKTCEDLTNRLVKAGGTIAGLAAELKQKDCEVAALKERLQGSEQKLQREEARNAWLNEFTGTLTSELQTLRTEALEEHEDQILVREKMFLKHAKYLTVTVGDEEAPLDISKAAVVLCRRNDVLYTSAERQEQLDRPFTSFPGWNCTVSSEGGTINVPKQFRGEQCALFVNS